MEKKADISELLRIVEKVVSTKVAAHYYLPQNDMFSLQEPNCVSIKLDFDKQPSIKIL